MSGFKDTATVTLNVNGGQAKQMMSELEQKISDTKKKISDLKASMADPKEIEKARKQLKSYEKQLDEIRSATEGVESALKNIDSATPRQLEKALKTLNRQLKDMPPGSETWNSHIDKIKELKARIEELKDETNEQESLWDKFKNWSSEAWPALDLLGQWGGGIVDVARNAVDAFASMDQEMANVRKFTGMTEGQVNELNEAFKNIDTRTSREDLNKLAQEAGRLGKTSAEDVMGFVRAADKINVALDDLGEGATLTLSKLTGVFGDEQRYGTEQALLKVGSVINELSQNCAASAPYLADFASRMGGVGAQANMTIPQIMAFAAVLDSNGQQVEASSTALSQVVVRMMQEPAKYAKVAGLDVKKFTEQLKTDVNGALILFLDTLQKAGGMDVLSPMFKDMGETGSRAIAALSTLATHIDQVKAQQIAANDAFREGTSVTKEFEVQNTTVQASIDKAKNAINDMRVELGERLSPVMAHVISSSSALIRVFISVVRFIVDNRSALVTLTVAIAAYNLAINMAAIRTAALNGMMKLFNAFMAAQRLVLIATSGTWALLTGNITRATAAFKLFSAAIKANPIGLAVSLITTAVVAIGSWINKTRQAAQAEKELAKQREEQAREFRIQISDISKSAADYAKNELDRLGKLYKATQDQTKSQKERIAAVRELQTTYPTAFGNLSQEEILAGKAASAYNTLARNIIKAARAKAAAEKIKENEKLLLDLELENEDINDRIDADSRMLDKAKSYQRSATNNASNKGKFSVSGASVENKAELKAANSLVEKYTESLDKSSESLENNRLKMDELRKANERLSKKVEDPSKIAPDITFNSGNPVQLGTGYTSQVQSEKDAKKAADRFASEKEWKEKEEAFARISYAKGESDYEEYTSRMGQIQIDYNQKLLDRTDVAGSERLKIQAAYWEAVNKNEQGKNDALVADENAAYEASLQALKDSYTAKLEADKLSAEEREAAEKTYNEAIELAELQHLKKLVSITREGTPERLKAEQQYLDARLRAAQRHQQEYERTQQEHEQKLASFKDKYFGMNAAEKKEAYDKDLALLTEVYDAEIAQAQDNAAERLRIEEAFMRAKLELQRKYGIINEEQYQQTLAKISGESKSWLDSDGGKALTGTMSTLVSGMSSIFSGLSSMMQAELELQTAAINKRYDAEIEAAEGNSYKIRKLEKQKEKDIAKAKMEANRKMFAMQVIQAVAQTAQNALNAYGSAAAIPIVGHILAPIAAAMAVAAGALQIATIKKQQKAAEAQGYSKGGFTRKGAVDEPAGIVHAGEWVASQKLLANPVARPMIEALDYAQRTNTIGSLRAEDVSRSIRANDSLVRIAESDGNAALMVAAVAQNAQAVAALNERLRSPLGAVVTVTGDHGINAGMDEYDRYIANKNPKSKK